MPTPTKKRLLSESRSDRRIAAWWAIVLIFVPLFLLSVIVYGRGGRTFFNPDSLETCSQGEYLVPIVELPIARLPYSYYRYPLTEYLITEGLWTPMRTDHPRWELVNHWNEQWRDGHADLHKEFGWNSEHWIEWTKANPEIAEIMWPEMLTILRRDAFDAVQIMYSAEHAKTVEEYRANLERP